MRGEGSVGETQQTARRKVTTRHQIAFTNRSQKAKNWSPFYISLKIITYTISAAATGTRLLVS
jgi:hypothetical protein